MKKINYLFILLLLIGAWGCDTTEPGVIIVDQPDPTAKIFASPDGEVEFATIIKVSWSVEYADSVRLNFSSSKKLSGTLIDTIKVPKTYSVIAIRGEKKSTDSITVYVKVERKIGGYMNGGLIGSFTDSTKQHGTIFKWAPRANWEMAMANGQLTTIDQLEFIYKNIELFKDLLVPRTYWDQAYWSSTPSKAIINNDEWCQILDLKTGPIKGYEHVGLKTDEHNVLLVEEF